MKALVAYGNTVDDLRLTDIPVPEIGEDEVLVKVRAAGICGSDIGRWILAPSTEPFTARPYVGGHEFAGDVVKIGKYVTGWSVGDRVVSDNTAEACGVCAACAKGDYLNCNSRKAIGYPPHDGGFAEYVRIPGTILRLNPNSLMKIPQNVSYEEASILDPVCNAYQAVIQQSHLLPGDDALFYGPGPLGLFGVQFAKLMGCRNIIVVGTPSDKDIRLSVAKKYGATHILINGQDDIPARVREICGPQGLGTVFDFAGPAVITEQAIAMLRRGGEVIRIGIHRRPTETGNYVPLITKAITMRGHMGYDTTSWLQSMRLLEAGMIDVKSEITHELPLEQWREGMELMRTQEAIKVVLHP